jgi:drug/metabolite transporter (DMT)-like permease
VPTDLSCARCKPAPPFRRPSTARRFIANIGVLLLNKWLLSSYGFKYPVLLTLLHMATCFLYSAALASCGVVTFQHIQSRRQFVKIAALSAIFTVTIILGNASLRYIPVSFNQAIGATTPFFTAVLSLLIQHKRESTVTYASLVPVVTGIVVATGFDPSFHLLGFCACLLATAGRALKTVLQVRSALATLAVCACGS